MQKAHQTFAAMGVGLIAMGEDLGMTLAGRALEHLLSYGDAEVRAGVPGALALLHASHPDVYTMDTLSRLSHDSDSAVARAALLSLGVIGAGTNNARLAGATLRTPSCQCLPERRGCAGEQSHLPLNVVLTAPQPTARTGRRPHAHR